MIYPRRINILCHDQSKKEPQQHNSRDLLWVYWHRVSWSGFHFPSPRNLSTASAIRFAVVVDCVIGNYSWPKRRTGENETLSSENDAPRKIARLLLSQSEQAQTEPVRLGTRQVQTKSGCHDCQERDLSQTAH